MDKINGIRPFSTILPSELNTKVEPPINSFDTIFTDALKKVDIAQKESQAMTSKLITGEVQDIHQVMIASQKASLSLQLTVQVRNKMIESYQEIMRMQV
jgi:flagellar hook-basal body complex protein FliE